MAEEDRQHTSSDITSPSDNEGGIDDKMRPALYNLFIRAFGPNTNFAIGDGSQINTETAEGAITSVTEVLKNPTKFLEEVSQYRGTEKDTIENFIQQQLLPCMEHYTIKTGSSCNDTLEVMARFSSPDLTSPRVAKQSLAMLQRLLLPQFGNCESVNAHIVEIERILRKPFVDGSFIKEKMYLQRRRAEVYSTVLALVLLSYANGHLTHPFTKKDKEDIRQFVQKYIKKSLQRTPLPKKDRWRYLMETILNLTDRLLDQKKMSQLPIFLNLCKEMMEGDLNLCEGRVDIFLQKLERTEGGSVDLHVIMKMLHGKMTYDPKVYLIVERIIEKHQVFSNQWHQKTEDWQFVILACQILIRTIKNHKLSKGIRIKAAHCLAKMQGTKAYRKSVVIRFIVEKYFLKVAFARDAESRKVVLEKKFNQGSNEHLPIEEMIKQICTIHHSKGLEVSEVIYEDENRVILRGLYDHKPVAITVLTINPVSKLYSAQDDELSPQEKTFQNETEILQRLSNTSNSCVPVYHISDTTKLPYHMICEYVSQEDLLHFLKACKEEESISYRDLFKICLGIARCMMDMHKNNVIHNQLRAEHVLLDDEFNIKITGFGRARRLSKNEMEHGIQGERLVSGDPSIRWAAPECLIDNPLLSPQSDVWAFGVLLYEIFTFGSIPYANVDVEEVRQHVLSGQTLPKEQFIRDDIYLLMQKCFAQTRSDRISFIKITKELEKLLSECNSKDDRLKIPRPKCVSPEEDCYDDLPIEDVPATKSDEYQDFGTNNKLVFSPTNQDSIINNPKRELLSNFNKEESLVDSSKTHLEKLKSLNHPHLVRICKDQKTKTGRKISYEPCIGENLRDYILRNGCSDEKLIRFAAQITDALNYLHSNGIVLCTLTARHIIVVNKNHVKLSGLHLSRSFQSCSEVNTLSCVVHGKASLNMYRWCAKEVIQEGTFSRASDIWSLGMTILEMFLCLSKDSESKPFIMHSDEEILQVLKMGYRPPQPSRCPDWVYILITQCWCLHPSERASSLLVLDCLTAQHPWESLMLQLWIEKHEIHENWPNLHVAQPLTMDRSKYFSQQDVEESISEECAGEHNYEYEAPSWSMKEGIKNFLKKVTRKRTMSAASSSVPTLSSSSSSSVSLQSLVTPSSTQISLQLQPYLQAASFSSASPPPLPTRSYLSSSSLSPALAMPPSTPSTLSVSSCRPSSLLSSPSLSSLTTEYYSSSSRTSTISSLRSAGITTYDMNDVEDDDIYEIPHQSEEESKYQDDDDDTYDKPWLLDPEEQSSSLSRTRSSTISLPLPPLPKKTKEEVLPLNVEIAYKIEDQDDDIYERALLPKQASCLSRPRAQSLPIHISMSNLPQNPPITGGNSYYNLDQKHGNPDQKPSDSYQGLKYFSEEGYTPLQRTTSQIMDDMDGQYDDTVSETVISEMSSDIPEKSNLTDNQIVFCLNI